MHYADYCNTVMYTVPALLSCPLQASLGTRVRTESKDLTLSDLQFLTRPKPVTYLQLCTSLVVPCNSATILYTILYTPTATMIRHAIGYARRPAPTTLFHVQGQNLATELSLWPGQSCGTVCQRQFITRTVYTLLNTDSNRTF